MELELCERRTDDELIKAKGLNENNCVFCESNNVNPTGSLVVNIDGLKDTRGNDMVEQPIACLKCGKKWVDVFQRIYPGASRSDGGSQPIPF